MKGRKIAILIDGGFFIRRLPKLVPHEYRNTPEQVAETARHLCKRHVHRLAGENDQAVTDGRWLDHVYRIFYYDAEPYDGVSHHPILNRRIDFNKTEVAGFRRSLFNELRRKRKFALRLGHVVPDGGWQIPATHTKPLLKTREWLDRIEAAVYRGQAVQLEKQESHQLGRLLESWRNLDERTVRFGLRQKGVDMRIGLDIASMTLKRQADTMILVTGDSDFVPAAKLSRREGVEFLLDPLWQKAGDDLLEHVDGIQSGLPQPETQEDDNRSAGRNG